MAAKKDILSPPALWQEVLAVAGFFAGFFLLLSFVSYSHPLGALTGLPDGSSNWGGAVGFFLARFGMTFLGIAAFWFVLLFGFFSVQLFRGCLSLERLPQVCVGCSGLLLASSGLGAWFMGGDGEAVVGLWGHHYPAGGYLGKLFASFLDSSFGRPGSLLVLLALFLFALMVGTRFSPHAALQTLVRFCRALYEKWRQHGVVQPPANVRKRNGGKEAQTVPAPEPEEEPLVPDVHEPARYQPEEEEPGEFQVVPVAADSEYQLPGLALFDRIDREEVSLDNEHYYGVSQTLEAKLADFGVSGKVIGISPGPVVTTYEFSPAPGIKINKIVALADDLAMGLKAESVRIVGSIPGKVALGIEIPNPVRQTVYVRDILASDSFRNSKSRLTLALGLDVVGKPVVADLSRMPHLLIAGATGAGKSVAINTIICSILCKATPDEVRLLMVDPKRIELSGYEDIPHLLHPVVVEPKMASRALLWAVREMERRYQLLEEARVKSFASYNEVAEEKLPLIVIIVDELADLMMVASRDVEASIARLAQMARAAGMHLILATQRPSVDVLTGLIKANLPTRISFKVSSKIDSRTILDGSGAEHLLGAGDMLFMPPGTARLQRIHGAYISEGETERIVSFLKEQRRAQYDESVLQIADETEEGEGDDGEEEYDEKYDEAVAVVTETGQASISMLQRRLRVGYNRAARMIELMEKEGVVGPADGAKPREVLARREY